MDTSDSLNSNLPARQFRESSRVLSVPMVTTTAGESDAGMQISREILLRCLARHWWHVLLVWILVSAPVCYVIYTQVNPVYEAFSVLRVEPNAPVLYTGSSVGRSDGETTRVYMETQVNLITSDRILNQAVANPLVRDMDMIKKSLDAKTMLREKLQVEIVKGTYLIRIALESRNPEEAATIVNTVVEAFTEQHVLFSQSKNKPLKETYEAKLADLLKDAETEKLQLKGLVQRGNPDLRVTIPRATDGDADSKTGVIKVGLTVTEQQFMDLTRRVTECDIDLIKMRAELETLQKERDGEGGLADQENRESDGTELKRRIDEEFRRDPDVGRIADQVSDLRTRLEGLTRTVRSQADPTIKRVRERLAKLEKDYESLWEEKLPELQRRVSLGGGGGIGGAGHALTRGDIPQLKTRIAALEKTKADLEVHLTKMNVQHKDQGNDTVEAADRTRKIAGLEARQDQIRDKLEQLEFESRQENFRVVLQDLAAEPKVPSANKRTRYLLAAPAVILFVLMGLFLMLEISSERVADPQMLSTRVQSEVYALPPLPTSKQNMLEADDQIEQFIQRLDHVRFAVCGAQTSGLEKGRCVLITSAIAGEGKTTLAAQLAARCGNAGVSTLLIDADLRRTSLCELLDIPEGPGLSDALKDGIAVEDLVIPVQGGTFFLLPAGTPVPDTSRVLQSRRLPELMTQFRQVYDLIIVDSPPVLPVPDALIVGQWVDGAVLSARYDVSRSPQVERARRQLDSAGIPVLGTVINGMRNADAYYGRYSYSRRPSTSPTDSAADVI